MPSTTANRTPRRPDDSYESPSRLVGAFSAAPAVIRQLGFDPVPMIAAAGLTPEVFDDPSNRIPYECALRLLNEAALRTRCPHIGLLLGRMWRISDLGLLGELVRHSPTVGAALQEFVVHHHLNSEGALTFVVDRESAVDLGYAVYLPFAGSYSELYDGALAAFASFFRELCGDGWAPSAVFFSRSAPPTSRLTATSFRRHCTSVRMSAPCGSTRNGWPGRWRVPIRSACSSQEERHLPSATLRSSRRCTGLCAPCCCMVGAPVPMSRSRWRYTGARSSAASAPRVRPSSKCLTGCASRSRRICSRIRRPP